MVSRGNRSEVQVKHVEKVRGVCQCGETQKAGITE